MRRNIFSVSRQQRAKELVTDTKKVFLLTIYAHLISDISWNYICRVSLINPASYDGVRPAILQFIEWHELMARKLREERRKGSRDDERIDGRRTISSLTEMHGNGLPMKPAGGIRRFMEKLCICPFYSLPCKK